MLDSELENFVRSSSASIEITATVAGAPAGVTLAAVANPETGETVGDTSSSRARPRGSRRGPSSMPS
jgi:hypothetical protein